MSAKLCKTYKEDLKYAMFLKFVEFGYSFEEAAYKAKVNITFVPCDKEEIESYEPRNLKS